jgi:hypothetical protein
MLEVYKSWCQLGVQRGDSILVFSAFHLATTNRNTSEAEFMRELKKRFFNSSDYMYADNLSLR